MGKRGDVLKNKSYHVWNMENRIRVEEDEKAYKERKAIRKEEREKRRAEKRYKRLKGQSVSDTESSSEDTPSDEAGYTWVNKKKKKTKTELQRDHKRRQRERDEQLERRRDECFENYTNLQSAPPQGEPTKPSISESKKHVNVFEEEGREAGKIQKQQFVEKMHLNRGHRVIDKVVDKMDMSHAFGGGKAGTASPWWTKQRKLTSQSAAFSDSDPTEKPVKKKKGKKPKKMTKEEKYAALRQERQNREAVESIKAGKLL
eukprot:TRINITY_DN9043_c1_g1_i1.p1 TRINITY_DN9043_c1_g1~~TRINITY_DN9043_c1_g1_i1.p1  ORF type:complete len:259 (+),score=56.24 TRINITY_DN9043_c1_g1_i1:433-1209(+)